MPTSSHLKRGNILHPHPNQKIQKNGVLSDITSSISGISTEFIRVDDKLERIHNMVLPSNATNDVSLKILDASVLT